LLLNHGGPSASPCSVIDAQTSAAAPRLVQQRLVQPDKFVEPANSSLSMNFEDMKMQLCDMRMEMCQMKINHGEISRNISDLKQEMVDVKKQLGKKKNEVGFGALALVFNVVVGVFAYLFISGFIITG
jgi:hypothetical protein